MLSKIDLSKVVVNHLKTFRTNQGKIDIQAILFFYILPFCLSFPLAFFFHIRINECIITAVISAFSIFGALLFALPMSFITLKQQVKGLSTTTIGERNTKKSFCKLLDITFHNLNYCIAIALFTILITIFLYLQQEDIVIAIALGIYIHIIFTAIQVLRRIHILMIYSLRL